MHYWERSNPEYCQMAAGRNIEPHCELERKGGITPPRPWPPPPPDSVRRITGEHPAPKPADDKPKPPK